MVSTKIVEVRMVAVSVKTTPRFWGCNSLPIVVLLLQDISKNQAVTSMKINLTTAKFIV
jgi:hypothetical protein